MIRLVYELLMMAVLLLKNVTSINNKLRSQNGNEEKNGIFMAPDMSDLRQQLRSKAAQPQNPQPHVPQSAPVAKFCGKCGSPLNEAGKCPNCTTIILRLKRKYLDYAPSGINAARGFWFCPLQRNNNIAPCSFKVARGSYHFAFDLSFSALIRSISSAIIFPIV